MALRRDDKHGSNPRSGTSETRHAGGFRRSQGESRDSRRDSWLRWLRRAAVICLGAAVLLAAPAHADAALKRPARPPLPDPMPQMTIGECPGEGEAAGCYIGIGEADINGNVYAHGATFTVDRSRFARLHELGHAYDATMMDAGERNRFASLMDMSDLLWTWSDDIDGAIVQSPGTPAEKFADAYAACRMGLVVGSGHTWWTGYGYFPTARQHRRICGVITRAGRDAGTPASPDGDR
jgi:hypothetical protein